MKDFLDPEATTENLAHLLISLRCRRGMSQLHLADAAGVRASVVQRAERGADAKFSTWRKLFTGVGCRLSFSTIELAEECFEFLAEEAERRRERRLAGLCAGKNRFY